jgi:hypothetical protein
LSLEAAAEDRMLVVVVALVECVLALRQFPLKHTQLQLALAALAATAAPLLPTQQTAQEMGTTHPLLA